MYKSSIKLYVIILLIILFIGSIGLIFIINKADNQTESTTKLYSATVSDVKIIDNKSTAYAEIYTEEYDFSLYVSETVCKYINLNDIKAIKHGQTVHFRINNKKVDTMSKADFIDIISLKTGTKEILSINEYNVAVSNAKKPAIISGIVFALLILSLLFLLLFKWRILVSIRGRFPD